MESSTVNEIVLTGRLIKEKKREDGSEIITMFSKCKDNIQLSFYCPPGVMPKHKKHATLQVKGHLRIKRVPGNDGKTNYEQAFVADEITLASTMTEEKYGLKGKFFPELKCTVYIKGKVVKVKEIHNWILIHVSVRENIESDKMITVLITMKRLERQPEINAGDTIYTVCTVATPVEEKDGKKKIWEDIRISDLAVG